MRIVAVNGSPNKDGRVSAIVREILEGARSNNHESEVIHLSELDIKDCTGCMRCQRAGACFQRDDIQVLEKAIKRADLIIWASPTHWANVSAIMLRAFERLFGFLIEVKESGMPLRRSARGKEAVLVTACSTPSPINWLFNQSRACLARMKEVCKSSGQDVIATFALPGTLGMGEIPGKYLRRAREFGASLF